MSHRPGPNQKSGPGAGGREGPDCPSLSPAQGPGRKAPRGNGRRRSRRRRLPRARHLAREGGAWAETRRAAAARRRGTTSPFCLGDYAHDDESLLGRCGVVARRGVTAVTALRAESRRTRAWAGTGTSRRVAPCLQPRGSRPAVDAAGQQPPTPRRFPRSLPGEVHGGRALT